MAAPSQIRYVHAGGSDAADGLSWATAKQTVRAAYNVLPDGPGGGTIYLGGGTVDIGSKGIWIGGNAAIDPDWWGKKQVAFIGVGEQVTLVGNAGSNPLIWLPEPDWGQRFENVKVEGDKALYVGVSPDGTTTGAGGSANNTFVDCYFSAFSGSGPCVWLGFCFWTRFYRCHFQAAAGPFDSDGRACILAKVTSGAGTGFVLRDCVGYGGGIRFHVFENGNTCGAEIDNWEVESNFVDPLPALVHVIGLNSASYFSIAHCAPADADTATSEPTVWIEGDARAASHVTVQQVVGDVVGPCVLLGAAGRTDKPQNPAQLQQTGLLGGVLWGQHDSARRACGPVAVRFKNLADAGPGNHPAPNGTNGAVQPGAGDTHFYVDFTHPVQAGDWLIAGGWIKGGGSLTYEAAAAGIPHTVLDRPCLGDGDWQWVSGCAKATATATAITGLGATGPGTGEQYYGPVFLHVPAGTISDNEAYAIAAHLQSYPPTAEPGDLAIMPGQNVPWAGGSPPPPPPPVWTPPTGYKMWVTNPTPGVTVTMPGITASPTADLDIVVVAQKTAATTGTNFLRFVGDATGANQFEAALSHHEGTDGTHWHAVAGKAAVDSVRASSVGAIVLNTLVLLRGVWDGATGAVTLSVNDGATVGVTYNSNVRSATAASGAWFVAPTNQPVTVRTALVWNRHLTATEWADVRDHLRSVYGIAP